jgi:toxin ParE1/3/4
VAVKKLKIYWKDRARFSLREIYFFVRKDSPAAAEKVKKDILSLAESLSLFPGKYAEELYLKNKDSSVRFAVIYNYKIIYQITKQEIIILDIFHTSRNPEDINT